MRVKLRGGPAGTVSSVELLENGDAVVELFDFGEPAQATFGNDVAFLVTVRAADRSRLAGALGLDGPTAADLLAALRDRFASYYEVKAFLEAHAVPFTPASDSWA